MPKDSRGEPCPADVTRNAVKVMRIATGEETEELAPVSPGAALGRLGGHARAKILTAMERKQIAQKAAAKRWQKDPVAPASREPA